MPAQSDYRYSLKVNGNTEFDVVSFVLTEGLSQLFRLELELAAFNPASSFSDVLDNEATLTFWQGSEAVRYVSGIVTGFAQGESGFSRTRYKMVIEPSLSRARYQSDNKIFQQQNSEKILRTLLQKNQVSQVDFSLTNADWVREYCVQYRETDLAFIERLAAEEGAYYYFEHQADSHLLHFCNDSQTAPHKGTLLYNATPSGDRPQAALWHFAYEANLTPQSQTLRDYTFTNPRYNLEQSSLAQGQNVLGEQSAVNSTGVYEKYDYPGRYKRDEQGKPFSQYRLEYERREAEVAFAQGDDLRVVPGYVFELEGHRRADFNRPWLIVSIEHRGYQHGILEEEAGALGNRYENHLKLIPHTTQWRPLPQPKPKVDGPQMAHVVGPEGEEIYCDEWVRVKIRFPWDRVGSHDEHSSCWVRVSQGWAGAQYGSQMLPRIGQEVIVNFLEGDPDQPIITGRTYHSTTEPPYPVPKHKTRMTIKSKTHKGNGFNELRFEDEKGQEEIFLHAEKDHNHIVNHDETSQIGRDRTEQVSRNETVNIGHDRMETVGLDESLTINRDQMRHIGRNRISKIEKDNLLNIGNNYQVNVHADTIIKVGKDTTIEVAQNGEWLAGDLLESICKHFNIEGYEEVRLQGPAGEIVVNQEGITLIGNVRIEGELVRESGKSEGVSPFDMNVHDSESFYKVQFRMLDDQGNPYANVPFSVLLSEGEQSGITDPDGLTPIFYTQNEENVKFRLHIDHEEDWKWETKE